MGKEDVCPTLSAYESMYVCIGRMDSYGPDENSVHEGGRSHIYMYRHEWDNLNTYVVS